MTASLRGSFSFLETSFLGSTPFSTSSTFTSCITCGAGAVRTHPGGYNRLKTRSDKGGEAPAADEGQSIIDLQRMYKRLS